MIPGNLRQPLGRRPPACKYPFEKCGSSLGAEIVS